MQNMTLLPDGDLPAIVLTTIQGETSQKLKYVPTVAEILVWDVRVEAELVNSNLETTW